MNNNSIPPNDDKPTWSSRDSGIVIPKYLEKDKIEFIPVKQEVFDGLLGHIVKSIDPKTEAHPVGVLVSLMGYVTAFLHKPVVKVNWDSEHHVNMFTILVGLSGVGRKGTATRIAENMFAMMFPDMFPLHTTDGIKTSEGLINIFTEGREVEGSDPPKLTDVGYLSHDKRGVWLETEYSKTLRHITNEKSGTIPDIVNQLFDGERIATRTKGRPQQATGVHLSMIGHIPPDNLQRLMSDWELTSGYANRKLWIWVHRTKILGEEKEVHLNTYARQLKEQLLRVEKVGNPMKFSEEAREYWDKDLYPRLSVPRRGNSEILVRADTHVPKLASTYALMDTTNEPMAEIKLSHLKSAEALWEYSEASCRRFFDLSEKLDNPDLEAIYQYMVDMNVKEITQPELAHIFDSNMHGKRLEAFNKALARQTLITKKQKTSDTGRAVNTFYLS